MDSVTMDVQMDFLGDSVIRFNDGAFGTYFHIHVNVLNAIGDWRSLKYFHGQMHQFVFRFRFVSIRSIEICVHFIVLIITHLLTVKTFG